MSWTRLALSNPVGTLVAVLLVVLFGALSLARLPVQLTPEVEKPEITIRTTWRAAAPEEVEAQIIEPQEKVLRGLPGMTQMLAKARRGQGEISIEFQVGHDLDRGLLEVLNRLNRVARYPDDADEPVISTVGGRSRAIAWFILKTTNGNTRDIQSYQDYVEEVVQTRFERVPGVARSEVRGGRKREVRITFDAYRAALLGIELPEAARRAGGNEDVSGGEVNVGKRRYTLRFTGAFNAEQLGDMVLEWRGGQAVRLRDVAVIEERMVDRKSFVITRGERAMAVNAHREIGVNVLDVMNGLKRAAEELREGPLARANLSFEQVYDETVYIDRSITMLRNNLGLGIALAVGVLWWFLRKFRATLMVAMAIPGSVLAAFLVLDVAGRTLNVISLAGLAFAVGMSLDAAIVVLENIIRLREKGVDPDKAAIDGPTEVWGALLASTATTVAIFLPIVFLEDEAGQLFADLALTIAVAVVASLIVALTVVPAAAATWLRHTEIRDRHAGWWRAMTGGIMRLTDTPSRRSLWIATLVSLPLLITWALAPKADYLPEGNRNLVFAFIIPPPGVNIDHIEKELGDVIAARIAPYMTGEKLPRIKHYFFVAFPQGVFMGARAEREEATGELVPIIAEIIQGFPDTWAFAKRASLFGGFGEGRTIDINIQGRNLETIMRAAQATYAAALQALPGADVRPRPGLELAEPELRLVPNERRIAEAGWSRETMALVTRALGEGLFVGDYFDGEERLDIIVRVQPWDTPEQLGSIPLATPKGGVLPVAELVDIVRTAGPSEIRRLDRRRSVTLQVTPPPNMSLEEALDIIKQQVAPVAQALLPEDGEIRYTGRADQLEQALRNMGGSFLLAIAILYLLMSALFRSFKDSLLVLLALPLATVGSVVALWIMNDGLKVFGVELFQPMDLLTMIGFIILLGLVVNNAILLVHQTRAAERGGLGRREAVRQAVSLRLRPILMSTLTSIFGMLPLLLIPGPGTELYRGLAAVIVGGMTVSTVFTLILLPSLLRIGEQRHETLTASPQPAPG
ncbi:MAG: efflux RND transporter permease subunit [Gammaproteobacteria bacterium]|nr:MAG: efflux RND transporter permease subunit [Gammaproteobacteria bacterium]